MKHAFAYLFAFIFTATALGLLAPDLVARRAPSIALVYVSVGLLVGAVALAAPASLQQALGIVAPYLPAKFRPPPSAQPQATAAPEVSR
jgi:biotin transporter BioY